MLLYHPSLDLSWQSHHWTTKPHNTTQHEAGWSVYPGRAAPFLLELPWLSNSSSASLCCSTKQAIWMHSTFPLFFYTEWFSFHTGIFFPHKRGTKVILDAEGKSANSSMHSQGMPGSTHRPVLFKAAPVGLWALSPAVYHIRVLYLIRAANNISTASPREEESDNTPPPLAPAHVL